MVWWRGCRSQIQRFSYAYFILLHFEGSVVTFFVQYLHPPVEGRFCQGDNMVRITAHICYITQSLTSLILHPSAWASTFIQGGSCSVKLRNIWSTVALPSCIKTLIPKPSQTSKCRQFGKWRNLFIASSTDSKTQRHKSVQQNHSAH